MGLFVGPVVGLVVVLEVVVGMGLLVVLVVAVAAVL